MRAALGARRRLWLGGGGPQEALWLGSARPGTPGTNLPTPSPTATTAPGLPVLFPPFPRSGSLSQQQEAVLCLPARPCSLSIPGGAARGLPRLRSPARASGDLMEHHSGWQRSALISSSLKLPAGTALLLQNLLARRWRLHNLLLTLQARPPPERSYDRLLTAGRRRKQLPHPPQNCGSPESRTALIRAPSEEEVWGTHFIIWMCRRAHWKHRAETSHSSTAAGPWLSVQRQMRTQLMMYSHATSSTNF